MDTGSHNSHFCGLVDSNIIHYYVLSILYLYVVETRYQYLLLRKSQVCTVKCISKRNFSIISVEALGNALGLSFEARRNFGIMSENRISCCYKKYEYRFRLFSSESQKHKPERPGDLFMTETERHVYETTPIFAILE